MNRQTFLDLFGEETDQIRRLNETKGHDYAGDEDVLSNFKEAADRMDLRPEQVWWVYADKHWDAITTYCREGQVASEPIEGRLRDVILYCYLLLAMVQEVEIHDAQRAIDYTGRRSG